MFKVLIAEDEPPIMRMIKSTLESVSYTHLRAHETS